MAYIGAEPNELFRVAPTKDSFTGDGSTLTFDLANNVPAGGEFALQVFVDNIRQEPGSGKAYTLGADGSGDLKRITFTEAPAASAAIYVLTNFDNEAFFNTDFNGNEILLDADGDTSITADTDDQIDIKIAGADDFQFTANKFDILSGSTLEVNGTLDVNGTELILDADADTSITADTDDQVDFKVGGSDKLRITATALVPATDDAYDLGTSSLQFRDVYTGDLNLNNTKTRTNEVDGTSGSWTIQEGENDLYLLNRLNGKKYKFNLTEVK
tara:strand:- start:3031 stop:3843 length:813 start_codon:yes stop_codon:yes gene_type:complete